MRKHLPRPQTGKFRKLYETKTEAQQKNALSKMDRNA